MSLTPPDRAPDSRIAETPAGIERIVLTGFMGSGKSTIGPSLAAKLRWRFVDLDSIIEERNRRSVANIFAESGEPFFRALERDTLRSCLQEREIVLALGGGALETPENRHALAASQRTRTVLLTASFETLYDRCRQQIAAGPESTVPVRPLLGNRAAAEVRLARRDPVYRQCAHLVLDTTGQELEQSVHAVLKLLGSTL